MNHSKDESPESGTKPHSPKEPESYEDEYYYSKKGKTNTAVLGLVLVGMGIIIGLEGENHWIIPVITLAIGAIIAYAGLKGLLDKTARLKFARQGLWTNKLRFVDWNDILKAQVMEETGGRKPQTILEIYLKRPLQPGSNQPDERLNLTDMDNKQYVEMVMTTLMAKRNELRNQ